MAPLSIALSIDELSPLDSWRRVRILTRAVQLRSQRRDETSVSCISPNRRHDRQRFYKYATARTAKVIISGRSLRWSSPLLFNDPFDVPRDMSLPFNTGELQAAIHGEILGVMEGKTQTNHPVLRFLTNALKLETDETRRSLILEELRKALEDMTPTTTGSLDEFHRVWKEMVPTLRILCLAEVNDSAAMWAYYTEKHHGVVLEFRVIDELDSSSLIAQPVIYTDRPPSLPGKEVWARALVAHEEIPWTEYFREYHYVKTMEWRHEREWRVVTYAKPGDDALFTEERFHPQELSAVYLGASISPANEAAIVARLVDDLAHVELFHSRFDHQRRQLSFVRSR
jgi:hypothetical protein